MIDDVSDTTLVELVNRVVDRGVLLGGEITISVADIDLLHIDLRVLLTSADRMHRLAGIGPEHDELAPGPREDTP
jgi:gas vesicle structural protein